MEIDSRPQARDPSVSSSLRSCLKPWKKNFRVHPDIPIQIRHEPESQPTNEIQPDSLTNPDLSHPEDCSIISRVVGVARSEANLSFANSRNSINNLSKRFRNKNKIFCNINNNTQTDVLNSVPHSSSKSNPNIFSSYINSESNGESLSVKSRSESPPDLQTDVLEELDPLSKCKYDPADKFLCKGTSGGSSSSGLGSSSSSGFKKFLTITTIIYVCFVCLIPIQLSEANANGVQKRILSEDNIKGFSEGNRDLILSIWDELTEDEINSIFGQHDPQTSSNLVPNFDIIEPKLIHRKARGKRSLGSGHSSNQLIQIEGLGRNFNLSISPNRKLLDPHFVFLTRHENQSEIMPDLHVHNQLHCFYQGVVEHSESGRNSDKEVGPVALSLCGGLKGFILTSRDSDHYSDRYSDNHHYVIHPVPARLHNKKNKGNGKKATGRKSEHERHHFLVKRNNKIPSLSTKHANLNPTTGHEAIDQYQNQYGHSLNLETGPDAKTGTKTTRKKRSTDIFTNADPFTLSYGGANGMLADSYWFQYRSNLFNPQTVSSAASSVFPSSYWSHHKSAESGGGAGITGVGNIGLSRRHRYDHHDDQDEDYDTSAASTLNLHSTDWSKGVLVYESTSSNEEPDTILPFYTKGRKRAHKLKPSWPASAEYSQNYSTSSTSGKFYRKGRRDDGYFGPEWKSGLDSDSDMMFSDKMEKGVRIQAQKQSRYDLDSNSIYSRERERGKPPSQLTIETAVFVDKDLYKHMKSNFPDDTHEEVVRIVLAMINAVQLLYQDPSLGHRVDFVLKRLEVLESDPPGLLRPDDIDKFLTNFCLWQRTENPTSDADPLHWDHALILTGLDLYVEHASGKRSPEVVGLAPVGGMCTRSSSCTVNEGRHFESVFVISHEIGHNLGMRHDGPQAGNDCDPTSHIMSPTLGSGKITWSTCSRKYLDTFLETSPSKCLLDKAKSEVRLDHDADGRLPGERFDADRQCVLKYGRGSFHATQQPLDDVCRDLHCRREHYTWTSHPALEGTYCGTEMWCRAGKCVSKSAHFTSPTHDIRGDIIGSNHLPGSETAAYSVQKAVDGVWGKWSLFTDCSSACLYSEDGNLMVGSTGIRLAARRCDSPRPENGGRQCTGSDRRYKTCPSHKICARNMGRTTISQYANDVCGRASTVDNDLTGVGFMMSTNDAERACSVWCETLGNGVPRSRGWSFPDGTSCKVISQAKAQSYCVAGKCQDFTCNPYSYYALSDEECSYSSSNEVTPQSSWYIGNDGKIGNLGSNSKGSPNSRNGKSGWTDWESHSECKLPCLAPAKGLELVKRLCSDGDSLCSGLALSVRLCKPDKSTIIRNGCTRLQTPFEYATKVCSKYAEKIPGLSGIGMQLSPTKEDKDRPCRIGCQDISIAYRFYMVNGEDGWFPAGTDCSRGDPDKKAFCVAGKCVDFGSDDTPVYRVNSKLMGRIENLFQRNKRQASYNIMEPLRVPSTMDESSLRDLVHKFSQQTGNFPSIASRRDTSSSLDFTRPIVMNNQVDFDYPPIAHNSPRYNPYSSSSSNLNSRRSNEDHYSRNNHNHKPYSSYRSKEISRGRSLNLDYVDVTDFPRSQPHPQGRQSGRKISSANEHANSNAYSNWGSGLVEGSFYEWRKIVSDCSVSCGKGIQEVIVECISGDIVVSDRLCEGRPRPGSSGYVDCEKTSCTLALKDGQGSSHIWNWLQSLLPKNGTVPNTNTPNYGFEANNHLRGY